MNRALATLIFYFIAAAVVVLIVYYYLKQKGSGALGSYGSNLASELSQSVNVTPAQGGGSTTGNNSGASTVIQPVGATFQDAQDAVEKQVDAKIYAPYANYADAMPHQPAADMSKNGELLPYQVQWEIVKWRLGYPSVPAYYTDYTKIDGQGRYYLNVFGKNYYYANDNADRQAILNEFIYYWQKQANYKPPTDGQVALWGLKVVAAMASVVVTEGATSAILASVVAGGNMPQ